MTYKPNEDELPRRKLVVRDQNGDPVVVASLSFLPNEIAHRLPDEALAHIQQVPWYLVTYTDDAVCLCVHDPESEYDEEHIEDARCETVTKIEYIESVPAQIRQDAEVPRHMKHRVFTSETPLPSTVRACEEELIYLDGVIGEATAKQDRVKEKHPDGLWREDAKWLARVAGLIHIFTRRRELVARQRDVLVGHAATLDSAFRHAARNLLDPQDYTEILLKAEATVEGGNDDGNSHPRVP